jgi:hypothetical protein
MSPKHDHSTLFLAPATQPLGETAGRPDSTVDNGAAAMRRLRNPFAVETTLANAPTETGHAV